MILVVPMLLWLVVVMVIRLWWFANNKTPVKGVTYDIYIIALNILFCRLNIEY